MSRLPTHQSSHLSASGVYLKTIISQTSSSVTYAFSHTDDYYFFGFIEDGQCRLDIDFEEYSFGKGSLAIIRPGQVHRLMDASSLSAHFLTIDSVLVTQEEKRILDQYSSSEIRLSDLSAFQQILSFLASRLRSTDHPSERAVAVRLTTVILGMIVMEIETRQMALSESQRATNRHKEIVWRFRDLLECNIRTNRSPSFYAEHLNITVAYLNEAVNAVIGTSVSRHIQDEMILLAKRQLVYTTDTIKDIARGLGFDDYSYFTRLFTKVAGISPTRFRGNYHE